VRAPADGYTLLLVTAANAINTTLYEKLSFNFISDIAPVAGPIVVPNLMVVHPSVPATTVPEFIAYAKANPGKINIASGPIGGSSHVSAELFKMMTGIQMVLVSYRGTAPAVTDLLGGQVQVLFNSPPASIGYIKAGTLRALAVTTATRSETLPDLPAVGEFVPGYETSQRRRSQEHTRRDRREAQQRGQCRPRRSQIESARRRPWGHRACRLPR
jgi:tripartite-type tricarboxylate transporter receptor subunit TctC